MPTDSRHIINRWPRAGYVAKQTRTPLFPALHAPMVLQCEMEVACDACGYHICSCHHEKPAAAPVAQPAGGGERMPPGWSVCGDSARRDDGKAAVWLFDYNPARYGVGGPVPNGHSFTALPGCKGIPTRTFNTIAGAAYFADARIAEGEREAAKAAEPSQPRAFAVGDRVRCVRVSELSPLDPLRIGDEFTVERTFIADRRSFVEVRGGFPYLANRFELVQP